MYKGSNLQDDQKVSVHLMITIQKVTSNVQSDPASLQTFFGTPNCILLSLILTKLSRQVIETV